MADDAFKETGLPPSYGFVLMTVNAEPGIHIGEIAGIMQLQPSTVTRFVDRLEHDGFLRRKTSGKNMRIYPTEKSRKADAVVKKAWHCLYDRYSEMLGEQEGIALTAAVYAASKKLK